jgi:hypothetical protein
MNSTLKTLVFCLGLLASAQSHALFRCGNVFQDRPCDGNDAQAVPAAATRPAAKTPAAVKGDVAPTDANASPGSASPFAMACSRMGKSSLDIIWKREAGALREAQYASAGGNPEHKALVDAVYERRGTAPQIRAAIETDCIGEKQRAADAAAAIAALKKPQSTVPVAERTAPADAGPITVAAAPAGKAADSAAQCAKLNSQLVAVQERARRGGTVASMEQIANDRRAIDSKISAAKC